MGWVSTDTGELSTNRPAHLCAGDNLHNRVHKLHEVTLIKTQGSFSHIGNMHMKHYHHHTCLGFLHLLCAKKTSLRNPKAVSVSAACKGRQRHREL